MSPEDGNVASQIPKWGSYVDKGQKTPDAQRDLCYQRNARIYG